MNPTVLNISRDYKVEVEYEDNIVFLRLDSVDDMEPSMSAWLAKDEFRTFLAELTGWLEVQE